ncbi:helix-turn-helix transcriptional regulator [Brachybacterium sp. AOP43-C2-M15]|uniref:helix-turn-helix transcriptional regulator n=1 Tax=Brachybacterium sp. AOP43-C2-M15 TaxID=3457661 RepID=UPI004033D9DD
MLTAEPDLSPDLVRRRRDELIRHAAGAGTVMEVFAHAARRLPRLVPYDAAAWVMADPATGLPGAPGLLENLDGPVPAGAGTAPVDPGSPARLRRDSRPPGSAGELRVVLRAGAIPWAMVTLWRHEEREPFTAAETDLVGGLAEPLGEAVRTAVRATLRLPAGDDAPPGVLTFDPDGHLLSADDHAVGRLEELPRLDLVPTGFGLALPVWLLLTAARSTRALHAGEDGTARALVPSERGRWTVCRATTTRDAEGAPAGTVVVLETAGPATMAPIIAQACGLTEREQEIALLIARGAGTAQIARSLFLSSHTVRDHVKSVLHKVGVSSRGELVAALYTEQGSPAAPRSARPDGESLPPHGGPPRPEGSPDRGMAAAVGHH